MSYEVLARKYRPSSFEEVVGQEHVIQALANSILQDRIHQAFIFSGTRGVGKTTLARILAKCLNCSSSEKPVAIPCNKCVNCEEIKLGRSLDFYEQDAASQRGIDAMKDLLQTVPQSPANGRYKVYLLDEAHMLTTESFNALLKNLEEPPKHVVFILATTNPEKLPKTVQSRCLQLNLKTVGGIVLSNHLQKILKSENINYDQESVDLISDAALGSVRDSLTLLDQAIAHGSGALKSSNVKELLGTIDNSFLVAMIEAIIDGDGIGAYEALSKIEELSPEYDVILKSLISILHKASIEKVLNTSTDTDIKNLAANIDDEFCQLLYEIAVNSFSKFNAHPSPKEALEVCILRMLAFNPIHKIDSKTSINEKEKKNLKNPKKIEPINTEDNSELKKTVSNDNNGKPSLNNNSDWIGLFDLLSLSAFARNYFGNLSFLSFEDSLLTLAGADEKSIPENVFKEFQSVLNEYFSSNIEIEIKLGNNNDSPLSHKKKVESERQLQAEKDVLSDPSIQKFLDKYDGNIKDGSIKPVN
jgi:DNA polymerase-3 subunit gamma/tau